MKPRNESQILRRRAGEQVDTIDQTHQAQSSYDTADLYIVTIGDEIGATFPTTGVNTAFAVAMLGDVPIQTVEGTITGWTPSADSSKFIAINLGEGIPVRDETIVRCDSFDGQLFFTYRGNGSAS